jgi:hypothetical protein
MLQEQLLVNCTAILPTWDKAISKLSVQTARTENSEDLGLVRTSFMAKDQSLNLGTFFQKIFVARMAQNFIYHLLNAYICPILQDFRTPKPAVFCSSSAKVHKIAQCMDDDGTGHGTRSINHFCPSQPIVLTSSFKCKISFCFLPFIYWYHQEMQKKRNSLG